MLDSFLKVAYNDKAYNDQVEKLAADLSRLPNDTLMQLYTGEMKLAFGSNDDWLEKYKGTPLFEEAMALEKADLEADIARQQARDAAPSFDEFSKTQDQIRLQKKMLDLKLVEVSEGSGLPMKPGGELPTEITPTAQGAGALGDVPMEGVQDSAMGMGGAKTASMLHPNSATRRFLRGADHVIQDNSIERAVKGLFKDENKAGHLGHIAGKAIEATPLVAGGMAAGVAIGHKGAKDEKKHKEAEANFQKAAFGMADVGKALTKNPARVGALVGAGVGAAGGALAGGPDNRLGGALAGGAMGAGLGHMAGGIGGHMHGGASLGGAVESYGRGIGDAAKGMAETVTTPRLAAHEVTTVPQLPSAAARESQLRNMDLKAIAAKSQKKVPVATHAEIDMGGMGGVPSLPKPNVRDFAERGVFGQPKMASVQFRFAAAAMGLGA